MIELRKRLKVDRLCMHIFTSADHKQKQNALEIYTHIQNSLLTVRMDHVIIDSIHADTM